MNLLHHRNRLRSTLFLLILLLTTPAPTAFAQTPSWQHTDTLPPGKIDRVAVTPGGDLFAGVSANGLHRSSDGGRSWQYVGFLYQDFRTICVNSRGYIYVVTGIGTYRSTDNGINWSYVVGPATAMTIDRSDNIIVGYGWAYRSTDDGLTWSKIGPQYVSNITGIAVNKSGTIFIATAQGGVLKSTNTGAAWLSTAGPVTTTLSLLIDSDDYIYAGFQGENSIPGLYRSTDNGGTWVLSTNGLTPGTYLPVATDSSGRTLVGNTDPGGLFITKDHGTSWQSVQAGLQDPRVISLAVGKNASLFAGTVGAGVFRSPPPSSLLAEPGLLFPPSGGTGVDTTLTLLWHRVPGAGTYRIQIGTHGPLFTSPSIDRAGLTDTMFTATGLLPGYSYAWRARAEHGSDLGGWSEVSSFATTPPVPSLLAPLDGITLLSTPVLLEWSISRSATSYDIQLASDSTFASPLIQQKGLTGSSFETDLPKGQFFYWRVRAANGSAVSAWTTPRRFAITLPPAPAGFWQLARGPQGGQIISVAADAGGRIYAGTSGAGIFRLDPADTVWTRTNRGLQNPPNLSIVCAMDGSVYASDGYYGYGPISGVYRSSDNGENWSPLGLPHVDVLFLAVDSRGNLFGTTYDGKVVRTTDRGSSWAEVLSTGDPRSILVTSEDQLFAGAYASVLHSTDGGASWLGSIMPGGSDFVTALARDSSQRLYALDAFGRFFNSTDNGTSWASLSANLPFSFSTAMISLPGNQLFISSSVLYRSTNGGISWKTVLSGPTVNTVGSDAAGRLLAGTDSGLAVSVNAGESWQWFTGGLNNATIACLAEAPDGRAYAVSSDGAHPGIHVSVDHGSSWQPLPSVPGWHVNALAVNADGSLIAEAGDSLFRSTDKGGSWFPLRYAPGANTSTVAIGADGNLYVGDAIGIARSTDFGQTWSTLLSFPTLSWPQHVVALGVAGMSTLVATIYEVTSPKGFYTYYSIRSTDKGATWKPMAGQVYALSGSPDGTILASFNSAISRSTDQGNTWIPLLATGAQQILQGPHRQILAASGNLVYLSTDGGEHWANIRGNILTPTVESMMFDSTGFVCIGTDRAGIYRSASVVNSIGASRSPLPIRWTLEQNFPNPFNPSTTIRFSVPVPSMVTITIFDLLGRAVATIAHERLGPGTYDRQWNARGAATGVYFCRLQVQGFSVTRKLLLIR